MTQALHVLANGGEMKLEIVFVSPALSTESDKQEQSRLIAELAWTPVLRGGMTMDRMKTRVPGILPRWAVEHVTAETAKSLKPGVDFSDEGGSALPIRGLEVMPQHEWEDGWVATK